MPEQRTLSDKLSLSNDQEPRKRTTRAYPDAQNVLHARIKTQGTVNFQAQLWLPRRLAPPATELGKYGQRQTHTHTFKLFKVSPSAREQPGHTVLLPEHFRAHTVTMWRFWLPS